MAVPSSGQAVSVSPELRLRRTGIFSYEKRSVIITTNLEFSKWNGIFYDEKLTSAIVDRLVHHSHLLVFQGQSYRLTHSTMKSQ
jgi:DNA replication protein DnaC